MKPTHALMLSLLAASVAAFPASDAMAQESCDEGEELVTGEDNTASCEPIPEPEEPVETTTITNEDGEEEEVEVEEEPEPEPEEPDTEDGEGEEPNGVTDS